MLRFFIIPVMVVAILFFTVNFSFASEEIQVSIPKGTSTLGCEIKSLCYIPDPITVNVGDVVEWTNHDAAVHTVTSGTPEEGSNGIIFSGLLQPGDVFAFRFDESGSFSYFCTVHPWMEGLIVANPLLDKTPELYQIEQMDLFKSGSIIGTIKTDFPKAGKSLPIDISFTDEKHSILVHMNYDIQIIQDSEDVLIQENRHSIDGYVELETRPLESDNPVQVIVGIRGIYLESESIRPVSETTTFLISKETPIKNGVYPKDQMAYGVSASDVICRQGFELMMKNSDGSAACVTSSSAEKLVQRDWGILFNN